MEWGFLGLLYATTMIKKDRKVVLAMISQFSDALKVIDKSYLKDAEIIHLAIQKHGSAFQYAPEEFRKY